MQTCFSHIPFAANVFIVVRRRYTLSSNRVIVEECFYALVLSSVSNLAKDTLNTNTGTE